MLDFIDIKVRSTKRGYLEVSPEFRTVKSKDLMIRGSDFYAVWDEEKGFWSTDEMDVVKMVDKAVFEYGSKIKGEDNKHYILMRDFSSGKFLEWHRYCKALPDSYVELDSNILFKNAEIKKEDYATKTLDYSISDGPCEAYEELVSALYEEEERRKLEWAIGAIIAGDSKWIQKFLVLFGGPGTGKSTYLDIIGELFKGYCLTFEAQALGSRNSQFALEMFRSNPIVAIDHDGDLYRIEDNTKINSLVSHETMVINEKFKTSYNAALKTFMIIGTNKPVKITDAKSGILRRLIDVSPTGNKIPFKKYQTLVKNIKFELGAIAHHCMKVYEEMGPSYYNAYVPKRMLGATNDIYNFIMENYDFFASSEYITLKTAYLRFKEYAEDANIQYTTPKRVFKEELKEYFENFEEHSKDGWNVYSNFLKNKIDEIEEERSEVKENAWISLSSLKEQKSILDKMGEDWQAQYDTHMVEWDKVKTTLKDIDTSKTHFTRPPTNHIVFDFDKKGEDGEKNLELNIKEALKFPPTYAELSKSGAGIHLHYIYEGDPSTLSHTYAPDIEIKVFTGKSSLRRRLSKCNDIPVATISSGLPLKAKRGDNMISEFVYNSEKQLRDSIRANLNKEIHDHTAPSVSFIHKILEDAYNSDLEYDVRDLRNEIQSFAMSSTNQSLTCMKLVSDMKFCSKNEAEGIEKYEDAPLVFFDVEVFPNFFLVVAKKEGPDQNHIVYMNPKPEQMEKLIKMRLVGFNNRKYDNHMIYACMMGYTNEQLYRLSKRIISGDKEAFFGSAYNLSYTDIYDFLSPTNKMSLKKWEIKLGIHHQELGLDFDSPVEESKWSQVVTYCCYDVDATEAVFLSKEGQADWTARKILTKLSGLTRNDTTNSHTKRIIVGKDKNPQSKYVYTDLSKIFPGYQFDKFGISKEEYKEGAKIVQGKSIYMGEDPSEGGYVYGNVGYYEWTGVDDIESMHPTSAVELNVFGPYTKRFKDILYGRLHIKHGEFEPVREMLDGKLAEFLDDEKSAGELATGLKGAINAVYGLTSASFPNELKDPRNIDNIVAKRGALFMITLKNDLIKMGQKVVHIKTDSIKIPNITNAIIDWIDKFGKGYGYTFEMESLYEKMCLINDSTYIAKYAYPEDCEKILGFVPKNNKKHPGEWSATGDRFAVPYIFKTLFSKEEVNLSDLQAVKSVSTAIYLDMNEDLPDVSEAEKRLVKIKKAIKDGDVLEEDVKDEIASLEDEISKGHDYKFVGRIGSFIPVLPGNGGGILLRKGQNDKFGAVEGTKKKGKKTGVYRWLEYEMVQKLGLEDKIDYEYYQDLADEAIEKIEEFVDFERFVNEKLTFSHDVFEKNVEKLKENEVEFDEFMNEPLPFS